MGRFASHEPPLHRRHRPRHHILALQCCSERRREPSSRGTQQEGPGRSTRQPWPGSRARTPWRSWANVQEVVVGALGKAGEPSAADLGRGRDHQPARDHRPCGTRPQRTADRQRHRLAGHPAPTGWSAELRRHVGGSGSAPPPACALATYFSGPKARWLLDNAPGAQAQGPSGASCCSAPSIAWLIWKLTRRHATDDHQRLALDADEARHPGVRTTGCLPAIGVPARHAARRSGRRRRSTARRAG